jgi:ribokinase
MVDDSGKKQIFAASGAIKRLDVECVRAAAPALQSTCVVLAQFEAPPASVVEAFRLARTANAQTVLDPAPAVSCPPELFAMVDVIRPNAAEATTLTGIVVRDRSTARAAGERMLEMGAGAAIVPSGDEGILVLSLAGEHWIPRLQVASVDATGAGDAFVAALAAKLAAGDDLADAAQFANAAAALSTTRFGAQTGLPRRDEVVALLRQRR